MERSTFNILILSVRSDIGGGPRHILDVLQEAKRLELPMQFYLAAPKSGLYFEHYKNLVQQMHDLPYRVFNPFYVFKLYSYCRKYNIDIVHTHGRGAGLYGRFLCLMGIKVVHTFHGIHQDDSLLGKLKLMMDYALRNLIDYYICVSKSERNVALKKRLCQEDNSSVVFNGINYESLRQKTQLLQRENSLSQWKLPKNKKVIGVLARNDFAKGIEILLENLAYFKKKFPEMMPCCVIAGGGYFSNKNAKYLNRLNLAGDVHFLGEVSEPASVFIMLDVYVSNSRWEGLPLSVMEAMSLGIPCLLSNVAGHQDLIEDGVTGHLFPLRNPEKFTQYLKEFLTEDSGQYVDAAKKKIERDFSLSSMVKGILKIYEKVYKGTT